MDTDYLIQKAHNTILMADEVIEFLPSELGVLCGECKDEEEFLVRAKEHIEEIAKDPEGYLESWNYQDDMNVVDLKNGLEKLIAHVFSIQRLPIERRGEQAF